MGICVTKISPEAPDDELILEVRKFDLKISENAREHHTDDYEVTEQDASRDQALVIRRGQPFDIAVTFDRNFRDGSDKLTLIFTADNIPDGKFEVELSKNLVKDAWSARVKKDQRETRIIQVGSPANALVAKYTVQLKCEKRDTESLYSHKEVVYLVCNPWCQDDSVFLKNNNERNEYVLNDRGLVYRGSKNGIRGKPWNYGQFEDFMLDTVFYLLGESLVMKAGERGDSVLLARTIAQVSNACNGSGVLIGNWSSDYVGGKSPLAWKGSIAILEQYWKTKEPVKFGQCWVFSAIVTTMCRCLGIPARSTTNFASAHDSDASVTIDSYWAKDGDPLDKSDSVWNFHVWNDVWMTRPDLEPGFGGWQAIDGTPQEKSQDEPGKGIYVCGPAPLNAMKKGNISMTYDGKFIFAEFNADRVNWQVDGDDEKVLNVNKTSVGKKMSTKAVGSSRRHDVTEDYKFPEGSSENRSSVIRAVEQGSRKKDVDEIFNITEDVVFDLVERKESEYIPVGKPFDVEMKISNKSSDERTVDVTFVAAMVWYNGRAADTVKREVQEVVCSGGKVSTVKMTISEDDYLSKLVDMCFVKVNCMAKVRETNQIYFDDFVFMLDKPELQVQSPSKVKKGEAYDVTVKFTNPFPYPLTNCEFSIEGAGHIRPVSIQQSDVPAEGEVTFTHGVTSRRKGQREIVVGFDSSELSDLSGTAEVNVAA